MIRPVTCFNDVMANITDLIFEKVTFVESEAEFISEKNFTGALKLNNYCVKVATEEYNTINNGLASRHKLGFIEVNLVYLGD